MTDALHLSATTPDEIAALDALQSTPTLSAAETLHVVALPDALPTLATLLDDAQTPALKRLHVDVPADGDPAHTEALLTALSTRQRALDALAICAPALTTDAVISALHTPALAALHTLELVAPAIDDTVVRALCEAPCAATLRALTLQGAVTDSGARALALCAALAGVTRLDLSHNVLGDAGASALATGPSLTAIEALVLVDCAITDVGLLILAATPRRPALKTLHLEHNPIQLAEVETLRASATTTRQTLVLLTGTPGGLEQVQLG